MTPRILFFIKSAPCNDSRRESQKETWLKSISKESKYFHVIGDKNLQDYLIKDNTLFIPFEEDYYKLSTKLRLIFKFVGRRMLHNYDYVIIMDDDVLVDMDGLNKFLDQSPDYFGNMWCTNQISGMFTGYSAKAFSILQKYTIEMDGDGYEDVIVSKIALRVLKDLKIITDNNITFVPYDMKIYPETIAAEIRPFSPDKMKNFKFYPINKRIISFCLYGNDPMYIVGAFENIKLARIHYPDWEMVFYVRDISPAVLYKLKQEKGVRVIECNYRNMMIARFLPCSEEECVTIHRDCDSRISHREAVLVNNWICSGAKYHVIRDHKEHVGGYKILGGLWGCKGKLPSEVIERINVDLNNVKYSEYGMDQRWLMDVGLWNPENFTIHQYDLNQWMGETRVENDFCGKKVSVDQVNEVVVFEGFFNRLNGLVNGYLNFGKNFKVKWVVNSHLPFNFEDIFNHIDGIEVENVRENSVNYNSDFLNGPLCYFYVNSNIDANLKQVEEAFEFFISKLKINLAPSNENYVGIHYRGFHSNNVSPVEFADWCINILRTRKLDKCFLVADCNRKQILRKFKRANMKIIEGKSKELANDFDRNDLQELKNFLEDVFLLSKSKLVLGSLGESTILDPVIVSGNEVIIHSKDRKWSDCWFTKNNLLKS